MKLHKYSDLTKDEGLFNDLELIINAVCYIVYSWDQI